MEVDTDARLPAMTMWVLSFLVSLFGCIITAYLVMIYGNLKETKAASLRTAEKVEQHMLDASLHAAGFARTDAQIKSLCDMVKCQHDRMMVLLEKSGLSA